jgi:hypothetical protein
MRSSFRKGCLALWLAFGLTIGVMGTPVANATASGQEAADAKALYKQYKDTPNNKKAERLAILERIKDEFPQSKEAVRAVMYLASEQTRGGPWSNLPDRAAYILDYLQSKGIEGETGARLQKELLKLYRNMGRWDLVCEIKQLQYQALPEKDSKRFTLSMDIGLAFAKLGRKKEAREWLQKAKEHAGTSSSRKDKADFALGRLGELRIKPVEQKELTDQAAQSRQWFAELKELKREDTERRDFLLKELAAKCPRTYHGRQAWLELNTSTRSGKDKNQITRNQMSFLLSHPFSTEAKSLQSKLGSRFKHRAQWADYARLKSIRHQFNLDSTARSSRRSARQVTDIWSMAGKWTPAAKWLHKALALQGDLQPVPEKIAKLADHAQGQRYLPAAKRFEFLRAVLDHSTPGEETPDALLEMALAIAREHTGRECLWPDRELGLMLLAEVSTRFPNTKEAKKAAKEELRSRERMGPWQEVAEMEQKAFDEKFANRPNVYAHNAFDLAVLWQQAGDPAKARKLMQRLFEQKRLDWKDRKKAELIMQRLDRLPAGQPVSQEQLGEQKAWAEQAYVKLRAHVPADIQDDDIDKVWDQYHAQRLAMAKEIAGKAPDTYHGNRAARALLLDAMEAREGKLSAETIQMGVDYLSRYAAYHDSKDLWDDLVKRCRDDGNAGQAARFMELAAQDYAHLWGLDEGRLAIDTAEACIEAGEDKNALSWLKLVRELDETGESSRAKKAQKLTDQILAKHPDLAEQPAAESKKLNANEQNELANKLMKKAAGLPESRLKDFKQIYSEIISRCPESDRVEEAYWRLANLYLYAYDPPEHAEIITLLERFLADHPDSSKALDVKNRLIRSYEDTEKWCEACRYYPDMIAALPQPVDSRGLATWLLYAKALDKCGKRDEATDWYKKVLEHAKPGSMAARQAQKAMDAFQP